MSDRRIPKEVLKEMAELRQRLADAEETLRAITSGEVDALVVKTRLGEQIFTLQGADTVYRIAIENVNEGVITLSTEGVILYSNFYFAQMIRTDLNRLIGASVFDFVTQEEHDILAALLQQDNGHDEVVLRSGDGAQVPAYMGTKKMQLDDVIYVLAVVTDLTLKKREEELIRTGGLIQSILEQSPNAVMVCNAAKTIIYASKVAHQLFGHNVLGQPIDSILLSIRKSDKPLRFADILSDDVKDGTTICTEKNGKPLHLLLRYGKLGEGGDSTGIIISLTDVTSLKQTEQLKDDFIGMVSHELRTPLTVVVGAIHTAMLKGITPEERQERLRDAAFGARELENLLENLLELSRFQADRLVINPSKIDIAAAVREVIKVLRATSQIHHLVFDVRQKLPPVSADEIRMRRILYNLVENAIKYSPRGGQVRIFARLKGDSIVIGVSDQGIGISSEDQARLFQPFQRLESGQAQTKGLGLGLSVCQHLVEAHRGRIWVQSEPGRGSTFFFSLPMTEKGTVDH